MKKIAAFAGSTSTTSINKQLASFAATQLNDTSYEVLDLNDYKVPLYSEDIEKAEAYPEGALAFNNALDNYDGFIVSLAEHNGSYAAAFKNLFDWASRKNRAIFRDKPVLVMATSPGGRGGATVLASALASFPHFGANIIGNYSLGTFYDTFKEGTIIDNDKLKELKQVVANFEAEL